MAYYDEPFVNPLDFEAQQAAMEQQLAHIQALRQMSRQPVEAPKETPGWQSAVTGTRIPGRQHYVDPFSAVTPLVAGYTADRQQAEYGKRRQQWADQQVQRMGTLLSNPPKGTPAYTLPPGQQGPQQEAQPASQADILGQYSSLLQMPLTRPLGMKLIENELTDVPKQLRTLEAQRLQHQQEQGNKDRDFNEKVAYHEALLGKPPSGGSFVQNGDVVTEDLAPIFTNYTTGQIGWLGQNGSVNIRSPNDKNMPTLYRFTGTKYEKVMPQQGAPQGAPQEGMPPLVRKPNEMPAQAVKEVTELGTVADLAKDLKGRFPANIGEYKRIVASLGGLAGKAISAGALDMYDPKIKETHEYFSNLNDLVARRLLAQGGRTLTANEIKVTMDSMPSPAADKSVWDRWFDRFAGIASLEARRRQELHVKGNYFDEALGAVVDMKGNVVKGTQSSIGSTTPAPAPAPAASAPGGRRERSFNPDSGKLE